MAEVITARRSAAIVEASIALAHSLGYQVVAEGVESDAQAQVLTGLGCGFAQGYHFSAPVPVEEATRLLLGDLPWEAVAQDPGAAQRYPLPA